MFVLRSKKAQQYITILFCFLMFSFGVYLLYSYNLSQQYNEIKQQLQYLDSLPQKHPLSESQIIQLQQGVVTRVVDGDTIEVVLDGQLAKVRYIGINTPETVDPRRSVQCYGHEAKRANEVLVKDQLVYLQKDVTDTDDYNRLLRYVYVRRGNRLIMVDESMVRLGFAQVMSIPPNIKYNQMLIDAQRQAYDEQLGLWGKCSK
jgi:micrococcal nuclease